MHDAAIDFVRIWASRNSVSVLDIGGRQVSTDRFYQGPQPRDLFPNASYDVLDIQPGPDVTIIEDATKPDWLFLNRSWMQGFFDYVVCTEVLEHVKDWVQVLETAHDALKVGGRLVLTCAGPGRPLHGGFHETDIRPNEFYGPVSAPELRKALEFLGFRSVLVYQKGQDTQATAVR